MRKRWTLRQRLLLTNYLMVLIPVTVLIIVWVLLVSVQVSSNPLQSGLAVLWPERGPALSVQYAVSDLRVKAEKIHRMQDTRLEKTIRECHVLEAQGIDVAVLQHGEVCYITASADWEELRRKALERCGESDSMQLWDDEGFAFRYYSSNRDTLILAIGATPFMVKGNVPEGSVRDWTEALAACGLLGIILLILLLGGYLSRLTAQQIERYAKNRRELIAGISHDIRTPLTTLKGYAAGIRDGVANTPEKQQEYVRLIYDTATEMEHMVQDLFLYSRMELGKLPMKLQGVPLHEFLMDAVGERLPRLRAQGLHVTLEGAGTGLAVIDVTEFPRIMDNIFDNVIKYKDRPEMDLEVIYREQGRNLQIAFADHGKGVAPEALPHLFETFYRVDKSRSKAPGSGIGLAVVCQLMEAMEGTARAETTAGGGLTILLEFPRVPCKKEGRQE